MPKIRNSIISEFAKNDIQPITNENSIKLFGNQVIDKFLDTQNFRNSIDLKDNSSDSDIESITLDLNKLSGLSSSSSLSWSDDNYETETSKKVYDELNKIDRVLRGEAPIPSCYDKDEFEQWMNLFPNLTIFDLEKTPVNSTLNLTEDLIDSQDIYMERDCDTSISRKNEKQTVIENCSKSSKLLNHHSPNIIRKRVPDSNKLFVVSNKPRSLDTDKYLKISPITQKLSERKPSSRSLFNRQISKEDPVLSKEYNSLPFLKIEEMPLTNPKLHLKRTTDLHHTSRNSNRLILPPIITDQFRSASAIPRHNSKTLSALSVSSTMSRVTRKYSNCFRDNPVSSRIERNGFLM